jgi:nitronate monooxygenase
MSLPPLLRDNLDIPVIGAPMFIVSNPDLVIEQCKAGIVGSFPALNARPKEALEEWLVRVNTELDAFRRTNPGKKVAPFAVNQIVHSTNERLQHDVDICVKHQVPIFITSLRAPDLVVEAAKSYGALVFHDVTNIYHAKRALQAGVDGLILVCAGAGGHAGRISPFALVPEVREFFKGPIILSGAIAKGSSVLAAESIGADLAYVGTRFIATTEANAPPEYKQMLIESAAEDIVYTSYFSGVHGNYLKPSIKRAGLDPDALPEADKSRMAFGAAREERPKSWKEIWGAGQGTGPLKDVLPTAEVVARLKQEYEEARQRLKL